MKEYAIVAPNNRVFEGSNDYQDAVEKATELSLRWGALFVVRPSSQKPVTFPAQRAKVMRLAQVWFETHQKAPGSGVEKRAKFEFSVATRNLQRCIRAHEEMTEKTRELSHI